MISLFFLTAATALAQPSPAHVSVDSIGPGGGGWMECVVPSRHARSRLFTGSDVGGFAVSEDGGRTYRLRNKGLQNYFVETIAEHPSREDILLLGGEGGVYRSTDRGRNWCHVSAGLPPPKTWGHAIAVTQIVFDEMAPDHVWLATGCPRAAEEMPGRIGRVYESFDAGLTWRQTVAKNDALLEEESAVRAFSPNMGNPQDLLLTNREGVWRSLDGGVSWKRSEKGLPTAGAGFSPRRLARAPSNPAVVYLTMRQTESQPKPLRGGVWKSTDGGASWVACGTLPSAMTACAGMESYHFWSDAVIAVDASDARRVWVSGATWFVHGLWKSEDGGATFRCAFQGPHQGWLDYWGFYISSLGVSLRFPGVCQFGTSGTTYRTENNGESWRQCYTTPLAPGRISGCGLETLCVRTIVPDVQTRGRFYVGFWDVGLMVTDDGGRTFRRSMNGIPSEFSNSCFALCVAPGKPERLFATFGRWGSAPNDPRVSCVFASSSDGGRSWQAYSDAPGWPGVTATALEILNDEPPYALACAVSEGDPARRGLFFSENEGASWRRCITPTFPDADEVRSLVRDGSRLYAGTDVSSNATGRLYRSCDGGRTWTLLVGNQTTLGAVLSIAADGPRIAFAAHDWGRDGRFGPGGCWLSVDDGQTWKRVYDAPLCRAVAFSGSRLVTASNPSPYRDHGFGKGEGVVLSSDDGETWSRLIGDGFDTPSVSYLAVDPFCPVDIWVGTGGNSVQRLQIRNRSME